jgi:hypothetical protein
MTERFGAMMMMMMLMTPVRRTASELRMNDAVRN